MRLLRVGAVGEERPAVLVDEGSAIDVSSLVGDFGPDFFADGGPALLQRQMNEHGDALPRIQLAGERLGPPIARPHKLLCIGLNYSDHAEEAGQEIPSEPILFGKTTNTIIGPDDPILLPPGAEKVDWEVELAIVMGTEARYLANREAAQTAIAGYALSHDVSERAYQFDHGGQWIKGKSCETFNPLGPWLVTPDEVGDVADIELTLERNGQPQQRGSTATMIFDVVHIVWYLSQFLVLEPGDVINTGTPPGVGAGQSPPSFLREHDVVELAATGLGRQRQVCQRAI